MLIVFILKAGSVPFTCFVIVLSFVGLMEFYRMAIPGSGSGRLAASLIGAAVITLLAAGLLPAQLALSIPILLFGLSSLLGIGDIKGAAVKTALYLMGILYVPLLLNHLVLLREMPHGIQWVFLLLVIVMSGDTGAFYVGSAIGKRKLHPLVSPNKSVEGSLGGMAGSVVGTFLARATFFPDLTAVDCMVLALFVGLMGQLGDLFESLLKRSFGVKDSGTIFPGHGGMLDRLDSILFAAPALYFYAEYFFR